MSGPSAVNRWLRYAALFVLGALLGASVFLFVFGHQVEELKIENRNLKLAREKLVDELESVKQSHRAAQRKREAAVEEIDVTVLAPKPDELTEAEIIRRLRKDLAYLKGIKTEQLAQVQALLHELLRQRSYVIEGRTVEIRVKTVAISRVLHLFVTASVKTAPVG